MKKAVALVLALATMLFLTSCSKAPSSGSSSSGTVSEPAPTGKELTIGILPAESAIPIILAKEKGFFDQEGVKVSIKAFSSPNDRNVAVQSKELDAAIGDVMTGAAFVDKGMDMKITSDISEDFKILSSPGSGITDIRQLAGKKISLVPNFILEYIMDRFAAQCGFQYQIVEIPSFAGRAEALLSNQIDGVVYTEPQAGMLIKQGAHLLGSSREAGIKGGVLMFTGDAVKNHPGDVKAFYRAYNQAIDYMNTTDAGQYSAILAQYQFPDAISGYLSGIAGKIQHAAVIDKARFDDIIQWTKDKGLIGKLYGYEQLTDFSFLQ